jgi:F1F0 ATPase subunit 2
VTDAAWVVVALSAGFAFGLGYYGALWMTVRRLPKARQPARGLLLSHWRRRLATLPRSRRRLWRCSLDLGALV